MTNQSQWLLQGTHISAVVYADVCMYGRQSKNSNPCRTAHSMCKALQGCGVKQLSSTDCTFRQYETSQNRSATLIQQQHSAASVDQPTDRPTRQFGWVPLDSLHTHTCCGLQLIAQTCLVWEVSGTIFYAFTLLTIGRCCFFSMCIFVLVVVLLVFSCCRHICFFCFGFICKSFLGVLLIFA